MLYVSLFTRCT